MDTKGIYEIISNVGFPIFVAVFMMVKTNKQLEKQNTIIEQLNTAVTILINQLSRGGAKVE